MKVLIVDDAEALRVQLRRDLEAQQYSVVEAADGLDALQRLEENSDIALIICDVNMPRMDGLTLCERLKSTRADASLPVIMVTTETSAELKQRGKACGVIAWAAKPYVTEKLISVVGKILRKT